jgi:hypothetical protein
LNTAPQIILRGWQKPESQFNLRHWSPETGRAFVVDVDNRRRVIQMVLPGQLGQIGAAFPKTPPTLITETCLLPPPCRTTEAAAASLRSEVSRLRRTNGCPPFGGLYEWEFIFLCYRDEILFPSPDDDADSAKLLKELKTEPGWEHVTRLHCSDAVLQERWAKQHQLTLADINAAKQAFLIWYLAHWQGNFRPDPDGLMEMVSPGAVIHGVNYNKLCARVHSEGLLPGGNRFWLADCYLRDPIFTDAEHQPFENTATMSTTADKLTEAAGAPADHLAVARAAAGIITNAGQRTVADIKAEMLTIGTETKKLAVLSQAFNAASDQLDAKTKALGEVISPLNRLYSEVELAEIRKRCVGKNVPDVFVDWVLTQFQKSDPAQMPTKGVAFDHCGPDTVIGKKLAGAGYGISKQRLADHLTVIRQILEQKGWLATLAAGNSRKRNGRFQPDDRMEDITQPTPAESAADRDDARHWSGSGSEVAEGDDDGDSADDSDRN